MEPLSSDIKDIRNYFTRNLAELYDEREALSIAGIIARHLAGKENASEFELRGLSIAQSRLAEGEEILKKILSGMPVQYALGYTWFFGLRFVVNSVTLIPRGETEELVQMVIDDNRDKPGNLLDIGTGSGSIAVSVAANLPLMKVVGWDILPATVKMASENAAANGVKNIEFDVVDILSESTPSEVTFDIIVSNPPYVLKSEKPEMSSNVLDHEPHIALFVPDNDPLLFYRTILDKAPNMLGENGVIYFEINEKMGSEVVRLAERKGFRFAKVFKDIHGKDRFVKIMSNE